MKSSDNLHADLRALAFGAAGSTFGLVAVILIVGWRPLHDHLGGSAALAAWAQAFFIAAGILTSIKVGRDALIQAQNFREQVRQEELDRRQRTRVGVYDQALVILEAFRKQVNLLATYANDPAQQGKFKVRDRESVLAGPKTVALLFDALGARHSLDAPLTSGFIVCKLTVGFLQHLIASRADMLRAEDNDDNLENNASRFTSVVETIDKVIENIKGERPA